MSYDDWLPRPYEIDNDPPEEEEPGCVICGHGSRVIDDRYCGEGCAMADDQGMGDLNEDPNPVTYRPVQRLSPAEAWQRYLDMEEEWQ